MKYKVYIDYTIELIPRPFYVGKGTISRVRYINRNKLHTNIMNKYGFDRRIIFETNNEQEAFLKERELIKYYNTYFYNGGFGANFTFGGEGVSILREKHPMFGKHHSEESKRKK